MYDIKLDVQYTINECCKRVDRNYAGVFWHVNKIEACHMSFKSTSRLTFAIFGATVPDALSMIDATLSDAVEFGMCVIIIGMETYL